MVPGKRDARFRGCRPGCGAARIAACLFLSGGNVQNYLATIAITFNTRNGVDPVRVTEEVGWTPSADWSLLPNLWLSGFTLLLGGLGFALATVPQHRRRTG